MIQPIKHYNDFSISAEQIKQYQAMTVEKRLEWPNGCISGTYCEKLSAKSWMMSRKAAITGCAAALKEG